jgi:streptogramin lyase
VQNLKRRLCCLAALLCLSGTVAAQVITEFSAGITPGARPLGIVAGPDGNLWFTESGGDRIGRITPSGVVIEFSAGLTPGSQPSDITLGMDGNLWFTEPGTDRIGRITPNGVISEFSAGISPGAQPTGIAPGPDGNIWFTEPGVNSIARISPAGVVTEFRQGVIPADAKPTDITRGPDGNMWFGQSRGAGPVTSIVAAAKIGRITPMGMVSYHYNFPIFSSAGSLTAGPDGNVWFTGWYFGSLAVTKISPAGEVVGSVSTSIAPNSSTGGITTGPDGNVWLADIGTLPYGQAPVGRIMRITTPGVVTEFKFGAMGRIARIVAGPDGKLWFTEPDSNKIGRATPVTMAVEFYNASLDHYFMTWMADETAKLDAGTEIKGWMRTGYSFMVHTTESAIQQPNIPAGAQRLFLSVPVCRYYIPPQLGDSHFFGRDVAECEATGRKFPGLMLEDEAFMQTFLPNAGICPDNTTPVYRVFSNRADANHRYMTDRAVRDQMVAKGWLAEGDGPDRVVMCAPQ